MTGRGRGSHADRSPSPTALGRDSAVGEEISTDAEDKLRNPCPRGFPLLSPRHSGSLSRRGLAGVQQPGVRHARRRLHQWNDVPASGTFAYRPDLPFTPGTAGIGGVTGGEAGLPGRRVLVRGANVGLERQGAWAQQVAAPSAGVRTVPDGGDAVLAATCHSPVTTACRTASCSTNSWTPRFAQHLADGEAGLDHLAVGQDLGGHDRGGGRILHLEVHCERAVQPDHPGDTGV